MSDFKYRPPLPCKYYASFCYRFFVLGLRRAKLRLSNNARALANVTNNLASTPAVVGKGEG